MDAEGQKALTFGALTLALGLLAVVAGPRLLGLATGPENEIVLLLKKLERTGAERTVGGLELRGPKLQYQRLAVTVEPSGERAVATGTLDFTGDFGRTTAVSSLGLERIPFVLRDGTWEPVDGPFPRLEAVVRALEARRASVDRGEVGSQGDDGGLSQTVTRRRYRAVAWYIRSEREVVEVSEDFWLTGELPDRPVDEKATARLTLRPLANGSFVFAGAMQ